MCYTSTKLSSKLHKSIDLDTMITKQNQNTNSPALAAGGKVHKLV